MQVIARCMCVCLCVLMSITTTVQVLSCGSEVQWLIDAPALPRQVVLCLPCDAAKPRSSLLRAHIIAQGPVATT
jgi:hypothetical protein